MMIVMNLIKFCEHTKEWGGCVYSLPLGTFAGIQDMEMIDGTSEAYNYTDLESIKHYVRKYVNQYIDQLVDHDNYMRSYISKRKLYINIMKVTQ
jgi:RecJ-like exonuclease